LVDKYRITSVMMVETDRNGSITASLIGWMNCDTTDSVRRDLQN